MNSYIVSRPSAAALHCARGFTLIELMIAMLLGLIVIAGVSSIFLANQQTYRSNEALSDVQEGSRTAFEMLARDIRQAGLTGCNTASGRVANVLNPGTGNWFADWSNALEGFDDASTDPALSGLTGTGAPVPKTSSLHILSTGSISATINKIPSGSAANLHLDQSSTDLQSGDIIVACNYDHSTILQITKYSGNDIVVHDTGKGVASPGNCSKNLSYPSNCNDNPPFPPFQAPGQIAKLTARVWYIGKNPVGGSSLYRLALVNNSGTLTTTPQEMVRNVTSMTIGYLQKSGTQFTNAATVTAANNWAGVDSAQVTLILISTYQRADVTNSAPLTRTFVSTATVRNRVN